MAHSRPVLPDAGSQERRTVELADGADDLKEEGLLRLPLPRGSSLTWNCQDFCLCSCFGFSSCGASEASSENSSSQQSNQFIWNKVLVKDYLPSGNIKYMYKQFVLKFTHVRYTNVLLNLPGPLRRVTWCGYLCFFNSQFNRFTYSTNEP